MSATVGEPAVPQSPLTSALRTERLRPRGATVDDAKRTFEYRRLEAVSYWLTEMPTDFAKYFIRFTEPDRLAATGIIELDGATIGEFMLRVDDAWAQKEVAEQARRCQAELGW